MAHILIVEDEKVIRSALRRLLERNEYLVDEAASLTEAQEKSLENYDLIISDLRLPGGNGTELIEQSTQTPVLIMTSYASLRSAVDAMKLGAVDYIAKPFDHDEMLIAVQRILKERTLERQNQALKQEIQKVHPTSGIIGSCPPMQDLFKKISKVAPTDATVLILGESGTGKELVARAIHDQSQRADAPLISVNCAAIPETLIESELFGHEKGAFTGATAVRQGLVEAADGGTLFLDEIGELPLEAQARLLRVLQESEIRRVGSVHSKKVDVRLVAATHRNLKELAQKNEFREDLYYRLNVVELKLPPLRDRGDDVLELADKLLDRACKKLNRGELQFSSTCRRAIREYKWPGNVRELENAVERAVILNDGEDIEASNMAIDVQNDDSVSPAMMESLQSGASEKESSNSQGASELSLDDYFQHFVLENEDKMTETELAQKLGISRKSLWERRQRLGIPRKKK
ncbi:sigma-54-dependent Fis family transcriptional regulator [Bermanella marisrubri]|uniref:Probable two-component response regulator n=1 Tax=Bermanella marisrubri TaxID=207949 RepID=Q1N0Z6_9GAMM|nr:sigma-54 dependent transcriptional regulator [Bermanella marisrubri]EAT11878.1 probable two-component response regulator [Oceanobacter sp. RED65] [Bermanella marisrubri]QIZ83044.1 sigma-54-dependent Fis family transcriptional regulator [Bermanella marisrubri]